MNARRLGLTLLCAPALALSAPTLASAASFEEHHASAGPDGATSSSVISGSSDASLLDLGAGIGVVNLDIL